MKKDRYRELFERSADAILIIVDDKFVDCNDATVKMLRYSNKQELLNTHPSQLSPPTQPDGRSSFEKANEMIKIAFENGTHRFEWDHIRADGEVFPVEVLLTAIKEDDANTLHVVWREIGDRKKTEDELHRLTSIVESTSDMVAMASMDGRLTYINQAGRKMLGWPDQNSILNKKIIDVHPHWAYQEIMHDHIPKARKDGTWMGETAIITSDGKEIPVSQVIMHHRASRAEQEYLSTIIRDISERRKAERFLNSIINTVADPIFVKDDQHRFVVLNEALCTFTGYERGELISKSDFDFFPAEQAQEFWNKDELVMQSGEDNINEEEITDADGTTHIISTKKSSFVDESGQRFLVGIIRDITELKDTEQRLSDNLQLLNSIIENQPACVTLINREGNILEINPAGLKMLAAPAREAIIGTSIYRLITDDDLDRYRQFNEEVCSGQRKKLRFTLRDINGELHDMDCIAVPLQYRKEDELVQLSIIRDITRYVAAHKEQERLKDSLRQAQKMEAIGTLAGGIAHDFNNILSAILGYAELAKIAAPPGSSLQYDLIKVLKAGERAKELIRQILTFSRKTDQQKSPIKLSGVVYDTLNLLRASLPTTIEIDSDIEVTCPTILADPTQMQQLIMNLGTNAFHAMKEKGGKLSIYLHKANNSDLEGFGLDSEQITGHDYLMLKISDTGSGMDAKTIERIFEPYYTTKQQGDGTGLGLSVVHGIIKSCKGMIFVDSELEKGTTFTVFLPCSEGDEKKLMEPQAELPKGDEHILLVDDEPMLIEIERRFLEYLGYRVTTSTDSTAALELIRLAPHSYDMLITDMTMPGLTGLDLAEKAHAYREDLPVILCTGYSETIFADILSKSLIDRYISKPINQYELAGAVHETLRKRKEKKS